MKKSKIINIREISRRLTGSPHRIRHDFVPSEFEGIIKDCEKAVENVLKNRELKHKFFEKS